ncbi:hypothetical protein LTR99_005776 [Exophiala xenobiotica]|uniref:Peptidase M20 dimerisation domain-containing protein n=1 Tax=Vermiconidia calcicola TaxID=1690605 RepID=A0AAV9QFZ8_9PEZI|nr:hypothetical protein LTR99_005776 [Exophiala xenobiotica]KAK5541150.1 hypothetical protein LTR25_002927 [Vermiconidia calcicola]KAK5549357.1 hypothetical protein LTR23_000465 [Chaetothyriales sp. CCFEE 6169]KAK5328637.1 hypothetical protein LTR93_002422 [Exophiala xenobiotica]KAK5340514.1 hypothetical protein LTR98_003636 [Exophiala xenobiotica]
MQLTNERKEVFHSTKSTTAPAQDVSTLKINGSRLMSSLHESCEFGKAHPYGTHETETGMARLALNDADKAVRQWFVQEAKSLGCKTTVDQMGNIFAVRPGKNPTAPPVMMGSHLDTQPTGGRYDGILGVLAGLEVLRTLHENDYQSEGSIGVVNWTNEEGARFPIITVSSGVWSGAVPLETAWNCQEVTPSQDGNRYNMKQELERIGFLGSTPASYEAQPIAAHFELHIEQGPILEDERRKIGVVTGGQAYKWFEVVVQGRDSHAGTTPMAARKDSVLAAAKMIVESNKIAKAHSGLITTGLVETDPGSINTMAHTARFTLDMRHPSDSVLAQIEDECRKTFSRIAAEDSERGVSLEWRQLAANPAVTFHQDCITVIEEAAEETVADLTKTAEDGKLWKHMVSGAGHDSFHTSRRCPTGMIFTPTREGLSHTPTEYCSPEDCALGAQVLLGAVVRYDRLRVERGMLA